MKGGAEYRVPLSALEIDVLFRAQALRDSFGLVLPSALRIDRQLSDMTLTKVLQCTGLVYRVTVHGFRSAFRTSGSEQTDTAHTIM